MVQRKSSSGRKSNGWRISSDTFAPAGRSLWRRARRVAVLYHRAFRRFLEDDGFGWSGQMAYTALFSVFPALLVLAAIGQRVGGADLIPPLLKMAEQYLPEAMIRVVETNLRRLLDVPLPGAFTFGALLLVWLASSFLNTVLKVLSIAYRVPKSRPFLVRRLMALGLVLFFGVASAISFNVFVFGVRSARLVERTFDLGTTLSSTLAILRWPLVLVMMALSTTLLYAIAPPKRLKLRMAWPGAVTFSLLWLLATAGFSMYIAYRGNVSQLYGAITGMMLLVFWFYLSSALLFFGGEVNAVWFRLQRYDERHPDLLVR